MGGYLIIPWHALFLSTPLSSAVCERMSNFTYLYVLTKPLATFQAAWSRSFTSKLFAWRILSSSFAVRVEYRDIPMCEHYVPVYKLWYTHHTNQNNSQSAGDLYHLRYPNLRNSSRRGLSPASSSASADNRNPWILDRRVQSAKGSDLLQEWEQAPKQYQKLGAELVSSKIA